MAKFFSFKKKDEIKNLEEQLKEKEKKSYEEFKKIEDIKKKIENIKEEPKQEIKTSEPIKPTLPPPSEEKKGITSRLEDLEKKVEGTKEEKKGGFKLPFSVRGKAKNAAKKSQYLVLNLNENASANFEVCKIDDGAFKTKDEVPHPAGMEYTYHMKYGKSFIPLVIQPKWTVLPIPTKDYVTDNGDAIATKFIIKWIQKSKVEGEKKKMSGMTLILIIIGIAVGAYVLFGGALGGG